jgi:bacteriocin biosynthesis cyclodehydratase domain-containing protein
LILHPQYRAFLLDLDTTAFIGPLGQTILTGTPFPVLTPLLDSEHTIDSIVAKPGVQLSFSDVLMSLHMLENEGLLWDLEEAAGTVEAKPQTGTSTVRLLNSFGSLSTDICSQLLARNVRIDSSAAMAVVVCDDELDSRVADFASTATTPWLLITVTGLFAAIGPMFAPGASPCYECFSHRRQECRTFELWARENAREISPRVTPRIRELTITRAADAIARRLQKGETFLDRVWTVDLGRAKWERHPVTVHESCSRCGRAPRTSSIQEWARETKTDPLEQFVSAYTGLISQVDTYDDQHIPGIFCAFAEHLFPPDAERADARLRGFRRTSSGKGRTVAQARTSAMMEAIERYSGVARGREPMLRASFAELEGRAVDPRRCLGFSDRQYAERDQTNPFAVAQAYVPEPFDHSADVDWVPAWSLTSNRNIFVAAGFCFYGYSLTPGGRGNLADSNGCAAAFSLEDSILRGILEIVERDAVGIWWYNRVLRPAPSLSPEAAGEVNAVIEKYAELGRSVSLLDVTNDLGIPAVAALSWERDTGAAMTAGFGADFDETGAVLRAITEMNQFLPEAIDGGTARVAGVDIQNDSYLHAQASAKAVPRRKWSAHPSDRIFQFIALGGKQELDVIVVNQTRADIGIPVTKVIVPGTCHFWRRLGFRRLYEVPGRMGWQTKSTPEEELNRAGFLL